MLIAIDIIVNFDDDVFMNYPGGKAKTFQQIVNLMPEHEVYIEPFLGYGSVIRNKSRAKTEIVLDLDGRVLGDKFFVQNCITTLNQDAIPFLKNYPFEGHEVVYCDPPYLPSSRKRERVYKFDLSEADHSAFLDVVSRINAKVIVSGYESDLYSERLKAWNFYSFNAKAHDGIRKECLWFNFTKPESLHDYSHLGSNFRERQTIKRRIERMKSRISELTPQERALLLSWLEETSNAA